MRIRAMSGYATPAPRKSGSRMNREITTKGGKERGKMLPHRVVKK